MASSNTALKTKVPMLLTEPSALRPHTSSAGRKPRFHEDFDAPLLYDLLDASPTSPYADSSSQNSSPRPSLDEPPSKIQIPSSSRGPPFLQKRNLTLPIMQLQSDWAAEPRRRSSVHDRMRKLAKKSLVIVRQRPSRPDEEGHRPTTAGLSSSSNHEYDVGSADHLHTVVATRGGGSKGT